MTAVRPEEIEMKGLGAEPHPFQDELHPDMVLVSGCDATVYIYSDGSDKQKLLRWSRGKVRLLQNLESPTVCRVEFVTQAGETLMSADVKKLWKVFFAPPKFLVWEVRDDPTQREFFKFLFKDENKSLEFYDNIFLYCDSPPDPSTLIPKTKKRGWKYCTVA